METGTKLRILYLYQHLLKYSDAEHPISTGQLIKDLKDQYGISVNRNTLANDLSMLQKSGLSLEVIHSQSNSYYIDNQTFDMAELKVLIDAVLSSKFITQKKSTELIEKLLLLTSASNAKKLRRHVVVEGRVKSENERGYYIVDAINNAIDRGCKVSFQYIDYGMNKQKILRHEGAYYIISPYDLVWDGDYYYVIGYSEMRGQIQSFRLDRIYRTPELIEEPIMPKPDNFDLSKYSHAVFRMYAKDDIMDVHLQCKKRLMNNIIDHFGMNVNVKEENPEHFSAFVKVCPSPTFYRWVFGWNGDIKILEPKNIRDEYSEMCKKAFEAISR